MTLGTFFEKFDLFAEAPDAVAKMRELVLSLAIQGSLVHQDPNEESAEVLLQQIESTRSRTGKAANGRKLETLPPIEPDESPYRTPDGWAWCRLGTLGLVGSSCRVHEKDWTTSGVPFLRAREIVRLARSGHVDNNLFITEKHYQRLTSEGLIPEPNDIMITGVGTIGVPFVVRNTDRFYFKDASVLIFKNWFGLYPYYLHLVMQSPYWIQEIHKESMGTTVHTLTIVRAKQTLIPLPPLAEQKRIVAKVDELMALCDRLEEQQQEREAQHAVLAHASLARFADAPTPANLDFIFHQSYVISPADLRKSILTLAVQGRLVPPDPNDEPAEELLAKIGVERLAAVKARLISPMKPLPPVEDGEVAYDVRPGRVLARLIELVMEIQTGPFGSSLHQSDYQVGGTPVINPASLKDGKIVPIDSMAIGPETLKRLEGFRLNEGDIVMARRGEMGRCAIVTKSEDGWLCGTGSLVLRMPTCMFSPFLALLIGAPEAREYLGGASVGSTMQNLNQGILGKMPVGVPPLAEQRRIVAKVDQLMALVDALETQLADSRAAAANLLSAMVAELTGTASGPKVSAQTTSGTGRRGRPRKMA